MTSATAEVPSDIHDVTPRWLTAALRADPAAPNAATVTAVRAEQIAIDTGFSSRLYRVHLTGDGVPASVIVKLPADSEARGAMEMMGGYRREVAFYQRVADRAPLATPRVYAARTAPDSGDFVLVLEDLREWENVDHLAGLTMQQARACIAELAGLHAWSLAPANGALIDEFPRLDSEIMRDVIPMVFAAGWQVYRERSAAEVSPAVARHADRFAERASTALTIMTERNMLVHGDIRADNMFFSEGRLKIVDYQMTARAAGAVDVAYLVSQGLPTAARAGRDEQLLREYLDRLADHGIADYGFDEAWRQYRAAAAFLMVLPVVILVGWDGLPERSRQLCLTLTDRAVATIDEIDATAVFDDGGVR